MLQKIVITLIFVFFLGGGVVAPWTVNTDDGLSVGYKTADAKKIRTRTRARTRARKKRTYLKRNVLRTIRNVTMKTSDAGKKRRQKKTRKKRKRRSSGHPALFCQRSVID